MKLRTKLWIAGILALPCLSGLAQDDSTRPTTPPPPPPPPPEPLFRASETSLDFFGSGSVGQETIDNISGERVKDNGRLGLGLGANHFFTRHLGLGVDAYTENAGHSFVDNTSGSLILRFPIDAIHLAPYVFGGAGYQFDPTGLWFAQAGGGLEVRFARHIAIFADARYVFTDGTENIGLGRLGLRIPF